MYHYCHLTPEETHHAATLTKYKGLEYLARSLHSHPLNANDDLKSVILVDFLYDILHFSTSCGMSWKEVAVSVSFAADMLRRCEGQHLSSALRLLQTVATKYISNNELTLHSAKLLCAHFIATFFAHYKLYQYVLSTPQEEYQGNECLTVECPTMTMKLSQAVTGQVWMYRNKMNAIDLDEVVFKDKLQSARQTVADADKDSDQILKNRYLEGEFLHLRLQDAEKMISEVVSMKVSSVEKDIANDVIELKDAVDVAIARRSIPVPKDWDGYQVENSKQLPKMKSASQGRSVC